MAREAVQLGPRQPIVLQEMADQLRAVGLYDASEAWDRRVLEIEPGYFEAIRGLALTQLRRGRPGVALETWQRYLEGTDRPSAFALEFVAEAALEGPFFDSIESEPRFMKIVGAVEARRVKNREELCELEVDLYPPPQYSSSRSSTFSRRRRCRGASLNSAPMKASTTRRASSMPITRSPMQSTFTASCSTPWAAE